MALIGCLGDLHGSTTNIEATKEWMNRIQPSFVLQVGDFWAYEEEWPVPLFWCFGNHEHGPTIQKIIKGEFEFPPNNHWLMGGMENIQGVNVMVLPGLPQSRLEPGPAHYPPKVYELCMEQKYQPVDIFLSHGCPFEFWNFLYNGATRKSERINFEEPDITELVRQVKPKYSAVNGHNHRFSIDVHEGITCIRLGAKPSDMFYVLEI
jgi:predicted phosphodiesterase